MGFVGMWLAEVETIRSAIKRPGVTLVELMIYMTILSLVTIGITQMVTQIQKANVQTINLADQFSEADLTLRRVQIKLGDSDKVEVADLDNRTRNGCLRLKNFEQYQRTALYFDGRHQHLRGGSNLDKVIQISGAMSRTVSVWVRIDPDHVGRSTVVTWGNGPTAEFGIEIANGQPELQLNCIRVYPQTPRNLADGGWHHIAVTYQDTGGQAVDSNSALLYIDGAPVDTSVDRCPGIFNNKIRTIERALYIGSNRSQESGFKGLISDLRIWRRALSEPEIKAIVNRDPSADTNVNNLHVRLSLDNATGSGITNSGDWQGAASLRAQNFGTAVPVKKTLLDQTRFHSFCMVDEDNDGLHELWESETALALPQPVGGSYKPSLAREWVRKSEDIFVPSVEGFFKVVGENPETVIANFAVGKGIANQQDLQQKAQSKPLASTRITRRPELCTINASIDQPIDNVTKAPISGTLCSFDKAFIAIKDYIPGLHGRLDIKNVTWHPTGGEVRTATNIPNMPARVTATWYAKLGILKLESDVNLDTAVWGRVMASTLYLPTGRSSDATVTFNFGIGGLPFFEDGRYRMYDFVDRKTPQGAGLPAASVDFGTAKSEAADSGNRFCGMRSYLATITSEAEQNHLGKVMQTSGHNGWKTGWIGANVRSGSPRIFEWVTGPEAGLEFWKGRTYQGGPYDEISADFLTSGNFGNLDHDPLPSASGNYRQRHILPMQNMRRFRYTNWRGGKKPQLYQTDYRCDSASLTANKNKCEPVNTEPGNAVAIHDRNGRGGAWYTVPQSTAACEEALDHSVCGFYQEFDEVNKEEDARIGAQVTLKMDRFREFCLTPDNATP